MTLKFHEDSDIYCLACRIEFFIPILRTSCCVPIRNSDFSGRNVGRAARRTRHCAWLRLRRIIVIVTNPASHFRIIVRRLHFERPNRFNEKHTSTLRYDFSQSHRTASKLDTQLWLLLFLELSCCIVNIKIKLPGITKWSWVALERCCILILRLLWRYLAVRQRCDISDGDIAVAKGSSEMLWILLQARWRNTGYLWAGVREGRFFL